MQGQSLRLGENCCYAISLDPSHPTDCPLVSEDGICLNHIIFVITKLKPHIIVFAKIRGKIMVKPKNQTQESTGSFFTFSFFCKCHKCHLCDCYLFAIIVNSFQCSVLSEQIKELNKQVDQLEVYLWWVDGTKVCYIQMITFSLLKASPSWK